MVVITPMIKLNYIYLDSINEYCNVYAAVQDMADAIGCEPHERSTFANQLVVEIDKVIRLDTLRDIGGDLHGSDIEYLENEILKAINK